MSKAFIEDLSINISLATKPISQAGFGVPLILGKRDSVGTQSALIGVFNTFAELSEMVAAGFATTDPEYVMVEQFLAQSPCPEKVAVYIREEDTSIAEAVTAVSDKDWYMLFLPERDKTSLHAAGDAVKTLDKIFLGCTSDITALDDRNNMREAYLIHTDAASYPECALAGMCLPKTPGTYTWKWKSPTGVIASTFSLTQLNTIREKHGFTMSERSGVIYTDEGITTGGQYIDIIQVRDYVKARLGEDIFALQVKNDKIAYTNMGLDQIETTIRNRFNLCGKLTQIAEVTTDEDKENSDNGKYQYTVTVPERSDMSANDRAVRKVPGIKFRFIPSGAIHELGIDGTITV